MLTLPKPPEWAEHAACADHDNPDLWFTDHSAMSRDARAVCSTCPVATQCLDAAIKGNEWGTWGGTSDDERRELQGKARKAG